jgi:hypothetical protein
MSTAAEYDAAGQVSGANCSPGTLIAIDSLPPPRRSNLRVLAALAAVAVACLVMVPSPNSALQDVTRLERLAPAIERARSLSPDAREAIGRVTARISTLAGFSDPSQEARRKAAIERINSAMNTKEVAARAGDPAVRK